MGRKRGNCVESKNVHNSGWPFGPEGLDDRSQAVYSLVIKKTGPVPEGRCGPAMWFVHHTEGNAPFGPLDQTVPNGTGPLFGGPRQ